MDTEVKMKVCDRCKKELDTNKESKLDGEDFELCSACAEHIVKHIRTFKGNKGLGSLFK